MHQVGDQPGLYYDAWSTNHQDFILENSVLIKLRKTTVIGTTDYLRDIV